MTGALNYVRLMYSSNIIRIQDNTSFALPLSCCVHFLGEYFLYRGSQDAEITCSIVDGLE